MAIEIRLTTGINRTCRFGPEGLQLRRRFYRYDQMETLPHVARNLNSWCGKGVEFTTKDGKRHRAPIARRDIGSIEEATSAIASYLNTGKRPSILSDSPSQSKQAVARQDGKPDKSHAEKSRPKRKIDEVVNVGGCLKVMLGFVVWVAVALLVAWGCRGMVARPILYGFFISSVLALPFIFPEVFVVMGFLNLLDSHSNRNKRRRR